MDNLFKKTLWITDLHFGRNGNNPIANQDNIEFLQWAIDRAKTWGAETLIMGGDWHDNRHAIGVGTIDYSLQGLEILIKDDYFKNIFFIIGNHDLLYREKRDVNSIEFAKFLNKITLIKNPITINNVLFLPWLIEEEYKQIKYIKNIRYAFGHLEMGGFYMNEKVLMPERDNMIKSKQFNGFDYVFSGHYHLRQQQNKILYTGSIMPFNFNDVNDENRGIMLLEWGKEPIFEAWPEQPLFKMAVLSELMNNTNILKPKMTLKVAVDIPLQFQEAQDIKNTLINEYQLRKIELTHPSKTVLEENIMNNKTELTYQSVDQIVIEGLKNIDSNEYSAEKLIDIYKKLPEYN